MADGLPLPDTACGRRLWAAGTVQAYTVKLGYCRHIWSTCWEQSAFHRRGGATLIVSNFIRVSETEGDQVGIGWDLPSPPAQALHLSTGSSTLTARQLLQQKFTSAKRTDNFQLQSVALILSCLCPSLHTGLFSARTKIVMHYKFRLHCKELEERWGGSGGIIL